MSIDCETTDASSKWSFLLGGLVIFGSVGLIGAWIWRESDADARQRARLRAITVPPRGTGPSLMERKWLASFTTKGLRRLGALYLLAAQKGAPPAGLADIERADQNSEDQIEYLHSYRDEKPFVIVWGVRPADSEKEGAKARLAWEASVDHLGGRLVLMADAKTVEYLGQEEFSLLPRAKAEAPAVGGAAKETSMP